ncbi:MAG: SH3 domain-containing protein, partial [Candidatus Faecivicinus sp.]
MKFFARKRLISLILAGLLLISTCAACAEQALVMKIAAVYASAKTSSSVLGTLKAGTQLEVVATKNGWAKVEMSGRVGYMKTSALGTYKTYDNMAAYTSKASAMYASFSTSSKKMGTIPAGAKVTVLATAGSWARVTYSKYTGFIAKANLTTKAPSSSASSATTAYASVNNAKVYNASGKVIGTVPLNTSVTVLAVKNGICQVKRSGVVAYMMKSDLSASKVEEEKKDDGVTEISPTIFYVKNDGAKVADSSGKVIGTLSLNTAVTVTAYTDTLAKVSNGSTVGFMLKSDLSASKVE